MEEIIVIGYGGHAKSLVDIIEREGKYKIAGFIAKNKGEEIQYRGYKILASDDELETLFNDGIRYVAMGIGFMGKGEIRRKIYKKLKKIGYKFPFFIDPSAAVANDVQIEEGTMIGKTVVLNSGAKIGKMAIINTAAVIEHECVIGDFTHVSVGTKLCGNVTIGNNCFIGAGTTIIQDCHIGKNTLIGAGGLVLNDIPDGKKKIGIIK